MWRGGIEDEDDAVGAFLNWSPALLVAPIARYVPEFNVNFSEDAGRRGSVLLILNNPTHTLIYGHELEAFRFKLASSKFAVKTYLTPTVGL